ncbi:hypothetical protein HDV00_009652 [Rhizophlyctis rosea]|nr:hypothetical protein HDV00_009652 [Rhizophlyctis rosea]
MPFPQPDDSFVSTLYPPSLRLKFVQIIHRHGERTPVHDDLVHLMKPSDWQKCHLTPFLHAFHVVEEALGHPDKQRHTPEHPGRELPIAFTNVIVDHPTAKLEEFKAVAQLRGAASTGQCFLGQLTDLGKGTMRRTGENLRSLYVDRLKFLSPQLDNTTIKDVSIRSTDYARTIESVQHLLDGLWPLQKRDAEGVDVSISVRPLADENMHPASDCASLNLATKQFRQAVQNATAPETTRLLRKYKHLGADETKNILRQIHRLYDLSTCMHAHGLGLPKGVTLDDVREMERITTDQWWMIYDKNEDLARLGIGRFLKNLKDQMMDAVEGRKGKVKLGLFSGHDSTVGPVLSAFKAFDGQYPDFAAMVNIELFEPAAPPSFLSRLLQPLKLAPAQPHYVRFMYNGRPVKLPACAKEGDHLEGDATMCTLEAFVRRVDEMVPKDYERMCRSEEKVGSMVPPNAQNNSFPSTTPTPQIPDDDDDCILVSETLGIPSRAPSPPPHPTIALYQPVHSDALRDETGKMTGFGRHKDNWLNGEPIPVPNPVISWKCQIIPEALKAALEASERVRAPEPRRVVEEVDGVIDLTGETDDDSVDDVILLNDGGDGVQEGGKGKGKSAADGRRSKSRGATASAKSAGNSRATSIGGVAGKGSSHSLCHAEEPVICLDDWENGGEGPSGGYSTDGALHLSIPVEIPVDVDIALLSHDGSDGILGSDGNEGEGCLDGSAPERLAVPSQMVEAVPEDSMEDDEMNGEAVPIPFVREGGDATIGESDDDTLLPYSICVRREGSGEGVRDEGPDDFPISADSPSDVGDMSDSDDAVGFDDEERLIHSGYGWLGSRVPNEVEEDAWSFTGNLVGEGDVMQIDQTGVDMSEPEQVIIEDSFDAEMLDGSAHGTVQSETLAGTPDEGLPVQGPTLRNRYVCHDGPTFYACPYCSDVDEPSDSEIELHIEMKHGPKFLLPTHADDSKHSVLADIEPFQTLEDSFPTLAFGVCGGHEVCPECSLYWKKWSLRKRELHWMKCVDQVDCRRCGRMYGSEDAKVHQRGGCVSRRKAKEDWISRAEAGISPGAAWGSETLEVDGVEQENDGMDTNGDVIEDVAVIPLGSGAEEDEDEVEVDGGVVPRVAPTPAVTRPAHQSTSKSTSTIPYIPDSAKAARPSQPKTPPNRSAHPATSSTSSPTTNLFSPKSVSPRKSQSSKSTVESSPTSQALLTRYFSPTRAAEAVPAVPTIQSAFKSSKPKPPTTETLSKPSIAAKPDQSTAKAASNKKKALVSNLSTSGPSTARAPAEKKVPKTAAKKRKGTGGGAMKGPKKKQKKDDLGREDLPWLDDENWTEGEEAERVNAVVRKRKRNLVVEDEEEDVFDALVEREEVDTGREEVTIARDRPRRQCTQRQINYSEVDDAFFESDSDDLLSEPTVFYPSDSDGFGGGSARRWGKEGRVRPKKKGKGKRNDTDEEEVRRPRRRAQKRWQKVVISDGDGESDSDESGYDAENEEFATRRQPVSVPSLAIGSGQTSNQDPAPTHEDDDDLIMTVLPQKPPGPPSRRRGKRAPAPAKKIIVDPTMLTLMETQAVHRGDYPNVEFPQGLSEKKLKYWTVHMDDVRKRIERETKVYRVHTEKFMKPDGTLMERDEILRRMKKEEEEEEEARRRVEEEAGRRVEGRGEGGGAAGSASVPPSHANQPAGAGPRPTLPSTLLSTKTQTAAGNSRLMRSPDRAVRVHSRQVCPVG